MPRRRGQLVRSPIHLGAGRANPVTTLGPTPYSGPVFGPGGLVHEPSDSTAEKLAPGPAATHAAATTPPPSHSGGTSGNLTVPGYTPSTPTGAPYSPTEPGRSAADFAAAFRAKRQAELRHAALASLTPLKAPALPNISLVPGGEGNGALFANKTDKLIALDQIAVAGRLDPYGHNEAEGRRLLQQLPDAVPLAAHTGVAVPVADQQPRVVASLHPANKPNLTFDVSQNAVQRNPQDPLGPTTLGNATLGQLQKAAEAGTLRDSPKGILSTPGNRAIVKRLAEAKQAVDASGPNIAALSKAYPELSPAVLKSYADAARRTGVPPQLLAGIEEQESDYGRSTLPGVHGGQNSAGAAGPFQIGNGTGASGNAWEGLAKELWGANADQHSIYNQHDAALAAGQYLAHTYGHATDDPSTWQAAAESYNHATWYGEKAVEVAEEHKKLAKLGLPPNPSATEALETAKRIAVQHGLNPTPWNGDVEGGDSEYSYVRADAKGAVNWAKSTVGTLEGSPRQLKWAELEKLGPSEPWCTDWVSVNLARRGIELPENPNYAGDYADPKWKGGTQLGTDIAKAKPGDLIVYGADEHIAMYTGNGKVIAGNYGNQVAEYGATEDPRGITAIVRPHYKGGRVKVKSGTPLPGSSSESTFEDGAGSGGEAVTGAAPGSTQTVAAGGNGSGAQQAAVEPASFTIPQGPAFSAQIAQPSSFEGEGESEQLWQALLQAATRSRA